MKWKNYGLWVSLASILYMVFKDLGMQIDLTTWETYVTAIIGFLAALGIISNPDKGKGFFDKIPHTPAEAITQVAEQLQTQNKSFTNQQGLPQRNQKIQQDYSTPTPANFQQNEYKDYLAQPNNLQQDDANQNVAAYPQEIEPDQDQYEVSSQINQYEDISSQDQTPDNNSFDKSSIHGMPAPPNEYM